MNVIQHSRKRAGKQYKILRLLRDRRDGIKGRKKEKGGNRLNLLNRPNTDIFMEGPSSPLPWMLASPQLLVGASVLLGISAVLYVVFWRPRTTHHHKTRPRPPHRWPAAAVSVATDGVGAAQRVPPPKRRLVRGDGRLAHSEEIDLRSTWSHTASFPPPQTNKRKRIKISVDWGCH